MDAIMYMSYPLELSEQIMLDGGDILTIGPDGKQKRSSFSFDDPFAGLGFGYRGWSRQKTSSRRQDDYIRDLKSVAGAYGLSPDQIDRLLNRGFEPEEIEEYLYCSGV